MANGLKGEVPLILSDGRHLTLVFDMDGLIVSETTYGKPMHELIADAGRGFMGATRALLFGATRTKHPELTLQDVSDMLATDPNAIMQALSNAHDSAMPQAGASAEGKEEAAPRPRGKTSGGNGAKRSSSRKRSGG